LCCCVVVLLCCCVVVLLCCCVVVLLCACAWEVAGVCVVVWSLAVNLVMKHQAACVLVYPSTRQVNWFVGIRLGQLVVYILPYTPLSYTPDVLLSLWSGTALCNEK